MNSTNFTDSELLQQLDIKLVNFAEVTSIISFAHLLCQSASRGGMFLIEGQNKQLLSRVRRMAKEWVKETRKHLPQMSEADALEVINNFDIVHRIAYGIPADRDLINKYTLAAFESRIRGDQSINCYTLFRQISTGIRNRDRAYYNRPLQWQTTLLDRWHKEFSTPYPSLPSPTSTGRHLSPSVGTTPSTCQRENGVYDTIQKVSLLLESDLWIYETNNQDAFKRRLVARHRHLLDNTENYDSATLSALQKFLIAGLRYGLSADYATYAPTLSRPA